eukprot:scaffold73967_cov38-Prasinocladus_malaysianus.AAC.1
MTTEQSKHKVGPFSAAVDSVRRVTDASASDGNIRAFFFQSFDLAKLSEEIIGIMLPFNMRYLSFINATKAIDLVIETRELDRQVHSQHITNRER